MSSRWSILEVEFKQIHNHLWPQGIYSWYLCYVTMQVSIATTQYFQYFKSLYTCPRSKHQYFKCLNHLCLSQWLDWNWRGCYRASQEPGQGITTIVFEQTEIKLHACVLLGCRLQTCTHCSRVVYMPGVLDTLL